jgi:hypothetical protein
MPDTIAPNPPSPFADADPEFRHLIPALPSIFGLPQPGVLATTGCGYLAVVPDEPMRNANHVLLPAGLCPTCLAVMRGEKAPADSRPVIDCRTCGSATRHDTACALCRMEFHSRWVAVGRPEGATLDQAVADDLAAAAAEYAATGGDDETDTAHDNVADPVQYPAQIGVFCDNCGIQVEHDYTVDTSMGGTARLEVARTHLRDHEDWTCTEEGDFCPACTAKAAQGGER